MNAPPKACTRCGSARISQTGAKTWRCVGCGFRMRVKPSGPKNAPENLIWHSMMDRCYNPANRQYADYGGRGIRVCDRWRESWRAFVADVGVRPDPKMVLDRENNDRNYEPGNVRWVTRKQSAENRRCTIRLTHEGRTQTLTDWAAEAQMDLSTLYSRVVLRGWDIAEALSRPVAHKGGVSSSYTL